jgi:hypothetical protein
MSRLVPHIPRGTIVALVSISGGCSFALGSLSSGRLADILDSFRFEALGFTFVNYHVLFLVSLLARAVNAFVVAPRLHEPDAGSTRATVIKTVNEVMPHMARNTMQRVKRPLRFPKVRR